MTQPMTIIETVRGSGRGQKPGVALCGVKLSSNRESDRAPLPGLPRLGAAEFVGR